MPRSICACLAQPRSVSALIPSSAPTFRQAPVTLAHRSLTRSSTSRIARSRSSSGYFRVLPSSHSPVDWEPPQNPGRFRVLRRWPDGSPHLFPKLHANISGQRSWPPGTYRDQLYRWLDACDIRDEHGQPVHLTPHQWRHTFGTRLVNRDVPQEVVRRLLDHDSPATKAHSARPQDQTVRSNGQHAHQHDNEAHQGTPHPGEPPAD